MYREGDVKASGRGQTEYKRDFVRNYKENVKRANKEVGPLRKREEKGPRKSERDVRRIGEQRGWGTMCKHTFLITIVLLYPLQRSPVAPDVFTYVPGVGKSFSIKSSNQRRESSFKPPHQLHSKQTVHHFSANKIVVCYKEINWGGQE